MRLILTSLAALSLTGCGLAPLITGIPASPQAVANRTTLDEDVGRLVTVAYDAAAQAASFAIENHVVTDPATIRAIGRYDMCAFAMVQGVRIAYQSGNQTSYSAAITQARQAIATLLHAAQGISNGQDQCSEPAFSPAGGRAGNR